MHKIYRSATNWQGRTAKRSELKQRVATAQMFGPGVGERDPVDRLDFAKTPDVPDRDNPDPK